MILIRDQGIFGESSQQKVYGKTLSRQMNV